MKKALFCVFFPTYRIALVVVLVGAIVVLMRGQAAVQGNSQAISKQSPAPTSIQLTGDRVRSLQKYLQKYGYFENQAGPAPQDGKFDERTKRALELFQRKNGLQVTGEVDLATQNLIDLPRCGVSDIERLTLAGWNTYNLTYGFQEFTPDMTTNDIRNAIQQALALWASVTALRFREVPIANNPDLLIRYVVGNHGDGGNFDGPGNVLAHAFYPPPDGRGLDGDVHFDDDEVWTITIAPGTNPTDLITIAAHEFGHSLGLSHSNVNNALMNAFYRGPHRFLDTDDVTRIQALYNPANGNDWVRAPGGAIDIGIGANGAVWSV